jgi:hypothetical protein
VIYANFGCLTVVIIEIVVNGVAPANSSKLLKMLQDQITMFYIKIELVDFIEGLKEVVEFTCGAKADGQLVFTFGDNIDELVSFYPNRGMCNLPLANTMILDAVEWAKEESYEATVPAIIRKYVKEVSSAICSNRPHRERAVPSVREETHAGEMVGQTERRKTLEAAEASVAKQGQLDEEERQQQEALEKEVTRQSNNLPLDDT